MVSLIKYGTLGGGEKYETNIMTFDGLSSDELPVGTFKGAPIPNGSTFNESDTGATYLYDEENAVWYEQPSSGGGGGGGTDNYNDLSNKPKINGVTLTGDKSLDSLGVVSTVTFEDALNSIEQYAQEKITSENPLSATLVEETGEKLFMSETEKDKLAELENYNDTAIVSAITDISNVVQKNLMPNIATTETLNGVTFTVYNNGSVKVDGTASANTTFAIVSGYSLPTGTYILSGCPTGGATASYLLQMRNDTTQQNVFCQTNGAETSFSIDDATRQFIIMIRINKNYTATNLVFYPMIRKASITDNTYQPYSPSNVEMWNILKGLI